MYDFFKFIFQNLKSANFPFETLDFNQAQVELWFHLQTLQSLKIHLENWHFSRITYIGYRIKEFNISQNKYFFRIKYWIERLRLNWVHFSWFFWMGHNKATIRLLCMWMSQFLIQPWIAERNVNGTASHAKKQISYKFAFLFSLTQN